LSLPRIGVFDSGVGGLTVLKAIAEQLAAHYIYFGDTARLPYGTKSAETVARYAIGATHFLEAQEIDLLVIACNSATALALPAIEAAARVPVVGVVRPGAAMAAEISRNRAAIVIATEATVSSHAYRDALQEYGLSATEKACPLFVPLVEEGWIEHPVTEQVARIYLGEAMAQAPEGADVLVLACTHYPLIAPLLRRIVPAGMNIVDSAESTARVVKNMIEAQFPPERVEDFADHRSFRFYVTDSVDKFKRLATRFLGRQVDKVEHVDLEEAPPPSTACAKDRVMAK
jgi:glutamate racemase